MRLAPLRGKTDQAFNINLDDNLLTYDVRDFSTASVQGVPNTTWTTAALRIERSNDSWTPLAIETGAEEINASTRMSDTIDCSGFDYLHVRVETPEGSSKTLELFVCGKGSNT